MIKDEILTTFESQNEKNKGLIIGKRRLVVILK
jgi:hypothetical protein